MSLQVHTDFIADLVEISQVQTDVGNAVFPLVIPTTEDIPAIVYQFRDGDREVFFRDSFGLETYNLQLDIYSHSYITNQNIYDALINRYNGFSGILGSTNIQRIIVASTLNSVDSTDSSIYRTILELTITV